MKATFKPLAQWSLFLALTAVGFLSFLIMAGDENPDEPLSLTEFFTVKLIALAVFVCVIYGCKFCYRKGMFPEWIDRVATEED